MYTLPKDIDPFSINFIKIDVEGYEYEVLRGIKKTLTQLTPDTCLFIEISPHARHAKETKKLMEVKNFTLLASSPQNNFLYCKKS